MLQVTPILNASPPIAVHQAFVTYLDEKCLPYVKHPPNLGLCVEVGPVSTVLWDTLVRPQLVHLRKCFPEYSIETHTKGENWKGVTIDVRIRWWPAIQREEEVP